MNSTVSWKHANKGLLVILGAFTFATLASIIFLSVTLAKLDTLITASGQSFRSVRLFQNLLISLDDAETGTRGYVITNDKQYLEPYEEAVKHLPQSIKDIKATPVPGISKEDIDNVQSLASKQMDYLQQTVDAQARGDHEGAALIVANGQSKKTMDELRTQISELTERSLGLIRPRQAASHDNVRRALSVAVAVSVFVFGICAVILWYFQRSLLRERALENTKSEFLSLASHQLRTPATNVKQYVGLLLDGYLGKLTKKQKHALEVAYKNNESEIRIMNDLLDVAKLDLQRIQLRKQRTNIVSVVKQVVKDYKSSAESKDMTLELRSPSEVIASVDREYLKGVIEKLVDNAVKYSKSKTKISVRVKINDTLGVFEIVVRDQGLGIQKREVPKLFMKFSRIANEFSANSEGSGLGLYWVKQVMELHGGTVEVRTKEGRGSKFIIRAPLS